MLNDDDMLQGFLEEAREHLATIEPDLLTLESEPEDHDVLNRLFRSVHSIKGGAGFFGLERMSSLAHGMENLMSQARNGALVLQRDHIDALLKGLDRLNGMVDDVAGSNEMNVSAEIKALEALVTNKGAKPVPQPVAAPVVELVAEEVVEEEEAMAATEEPEVDPGSPASAGSPGRRLCRFKLNEQEVAAVGKDHMNLYAVSLFLQRDIMSKGKTPFQFISDLEELGRFIDSFLDMDEQGPLEEGVEHDLLFTFIFASILEPSHAAEGLAISPFQITLIQPSDVAAGEIEIQTRDNSLVVQTPTAPQAEPPKTKPKAKSPAAAPAQSVIQAVAPESAPAAAEPSVAAAPVQPLPAPPALAPKAGGTPLPPPKGDKAAVKAVKADESIRVSVGKLNKLVDLAGELVLVRNQLLQTGERYGKQMPGIMPIMQSLNIVTTELQEEILNTRMQPVSVVFGKFPRLIRELGSTMGKEIQLVIEGGEVELDKTVLEALSDPLTHMIRNTADHGIESPAERKKAGKPVEGTLLLKAYHESGQVIILVKDDGKGIDPERVAKAAYDKGVITLDEFYNLPEREKINLIFRPGFSTAEKVSNVSGRGVGMDVVRSNIEGIGGTVELTSVAGQGTTLKLTLPLTMAIVSCLIVESEAQRFAIPQINLEELVMLKEEDYKESLGFVQGKEVLKLRGDLLPLVALSQGLGITGTKEFAYRQILREQANGETTSGKGRNANGYRLSEAVEDEAQDAVRILIISVGINKVGIIVDSIVGSEEIVVKPMPEYLKHLGQFSGATILGDGTVAMIIDTLGFVQRNKLYFVDYKAESRKKETDKKGKAEAQSILIFDNGTEEQFAITIPLIQRVDEIDLKRIQHVGDKEYLEYRGEQMRLLHLADYLPVQKPVGLPEVAHIIIPKETRIPVGILIHRVIDTKTLTVDVAAGAIQVEGILGSTLIDGKITLLLDLYAILEMGEPDALHRVKFEHHIVSQSKILLVEDTPLFLTIVKEYLSSVGFEVVTAVDGKQGLEKLEEQHFDLVLSDIEMPVMDGFGLIKAIRSQEKYRKLPVLALTSLSDNDTVQQGLKAGFNEWLVKLDKEQILSTINRYLSN